MAGSARSRRRTWLVGLAVLVTFTIALVFWAGRDPATDSSAGPVIGAQPTSAGIESDASTTTSTEPESSQTPPGGLSLPPLPPLPNDSNLRDASHAHAVTLQVTSDKPILRMAFRVRGGRPESGYRTFLQSPVSITTTAYGDGLLAEIGAQASPAATTMTCTASIDGAVKSRRTVKGGWAVAVCLG